VSAHMPQREAACLEAGLVETVPSQLDSSGKHCISNLTDKAPLIRCGAYLYSSYHHRQKCDSCKAMIRKAVT
jgi:hypothetical protein